MNEWMDGWMDEWMNGWMDDIQMTSISSKSSLHKNALLFIYLSNTVHIHIQFISPADNPLRRPFSSPPPLPPSLAAIPIVPITPIAPVLFDPLSVSPFPLASSGRIGMGEYVWLICMHWLKNAGSAPPSIRCRGSTSSRRLSVNEMKGILSERRSHSALRPCSRGVVDRGAGPNVLSPPDRMGVVCEEKECRFSGYVSANKLSIPPYGGNG